ncbi:MAG: AtpZ/AtpI family protein [Desulfotomaculaceae bacterium]
MNPLKALAVSSAIGLELALCMVGGYYLGRYLDGQFATTPWLTVTALVFGLIMGVWGTYKLLVYFLDE